MGKFDAVTQKLPKIPPEIRYRDEGGEAHQIKIDEVKGKITERDPAALMQLYAAARALAEDKEQEAKELRVTVVAYEQLLIKAYEDRGLNSMKIKGLGTLRTDPVPYTSVTDKDAYHQWCLDNGFQDQMQLPWGTTNSTMKEKLLAGEELPDCVAVYNKPTVVFTREK